jgi:hypothetical protein
MRRQLSNVSSLRFEEYQVTLENPNLWSGFEKGYCERLMVK